MSTLSYQRQMNIDRAGQLMTALLKDSPGQATEQAVNLSMAYCGAMSLATQERYLALLQGLVEAERKRHANSASE